MTKTVQIYKGAHYDACILPDGRLCVSSTRRQYGKILNAEQSPEWIKAIETAADDGEAHALCRAVISA